MASKHLHPMCSYAVRMRDYERRLLKSAIDECAGDEVAAADLLGIHVIYMRSRVTYLGGIRPDQPKNEPPLSDNKRTWTVLSNAMARERKRLEHRARRPTQPPAAVADVATDDVSADTPSVDASESEAPHA